MEYVERHFNQGTPEIVRLCQTSKDLYNKCNWHLRQAWTAATPLPSMSELVHLVQDENSYKTLHNTKTAKQTIRQCLTDWSNFFKALRAYKANPKSFKKEPKPPNAKEEMAQVVFYDETIKRKPVRQGWLVPTNDCFKIRSDRKFNQVVICPKRFGFVIEVRYQVSPVAKPVTDKDRVCCIDLGVNNLCSITSDQTSPLLVNGRMLKSVNQWFNKHPNKRNSRKRYWRLENCFHHVSAMIVRLCVKHGIGTIIVGQNKGWKSKMEMGKVNNQNFQYISFLNLVQKIQYKALALGIEVVLTEESYTSKASFLDRDPLDGSLSTGKRIKRGLYETSTGRLLNADVNGSANIGRKVIQNSEILGRLDRSLAARPVRVNPLRWFDSPNVQTYKIV